MTEVPLSSTMIVRSGLPICMGSTLFAILAAFSAFSPVMLVSHASGKNSRRASQPSPRRNIAAVF